MSVVHFTTELSGGAGGYVKSIHIGMQDLGLPSFLITRERNGLRNTVTIKPLTRFMGSLRARWDTILGIFGLINTDYAIFGIEKSPVVFSDIQNALESQTPTAFIFYWVSYFVNFECMFELRQAYPNVPFVFVCLDEAFLTGGCHYSWGCPRYEESCKNCPAVYMSHGKKRIEKEFRQRQALVSTINPIVIYPTTNLQKMGMKSAVLRNTRSAVIPLGAITNREQYSVMNAVNHESSIGRNKKENVTLLVRSSREYRKGCDLFIAAIKDLSKKIPDLRSRLVVISIGDATLMKAQIDKYVNHVDYGYVQRKELISIYEKTDVLIVTSREDGGPLMINQCVALGIFVISTPVGVAKDLIIDKKNGLITRDITSNAISDSLMTYLESSQTTSTVTQPEPFSGTSISSLTTEGYIYSMINIIKST